MLPAASGMNSMRLAQDGRAVLLLQRVEDGLVPEVELVLEDELPDHQRDQHGGHQPGDLPAPLRRPEAARGAPESAHQPRLVFAPPCSVSSSCAFFAMKNRAFAGGLVRVPSGQRGQVPKVQSSSARRLADAHEAMTLSGIVAAVGTIDHARRRSCKTSRSSPPRCSPAPRSTSTSPSSRRGLRSTTGRCSPNGSRATRTAS